MVSFASTPPGTRRPVRGARVNLYFFQKIVNDFGKMLKCAMVKKRLKWGEIGWGYEAPFGEPLKRSGRYGLVTEILAK